MNADSENARDVTAKRRELLTCLLLVLATLTVYWQVQTHDFVNIDDNMYVYDNRQVQSGLTTETVVWAFTTFHTGNWHPLTWLSHMLDDQLFGMNPHRHHLVNLLFHIANTVLLFHVFRRMTENLWASAFVAALFALHPLHVESVAWISERKDLLSTFFWMLAMWSYLEYVGHRRVAGYAGVVLFFALGLMSKPMVVTLPLVLLLLDFWPLQRLRFGPAGSGDAPHREPGIKKLVAEKIPLFVLAALSAAVTFLAQTHEGAVVSLDVIPADARVANALVSYASYIGKMIWPDGLAVIYPHPAMFAWWQIAGAVVLLVAVSFLGVTLAKHHRYFIVGWLWYLGTLVPVIGLVQVGGQSMADRYTYVPFIGLFIAVAWGVPGLAARWRHGKKVLAASAAAVLAIFGAATWKQAGYWKNSTALFEHALAVTSDNWLAHNNLGAALSEKGRITAAMAHYNRALRIRPDYVDALVNLALALEKQERSEQALGYFGRALRIEPNHVDARFNLGKIFYKQGDTEKAMGHFLHVLQVEPDHAQAHYALGNALYRLGRSEDAISHYKQALRLSPGNEDLLVNLGAALAGQGRFDAAIEHYRTALRLKPEHVDAHFNLGAAYFRKGNIDAAVEHFQEVLKINPEDGVAQNNLIKLLRLQRQRK